MSYSLFTSQVTQTLVLPSAGDQSVVIRKLAPKHLAEAARESQRVALEALMAIGGPSVLEQFKGLSKDKSAEADTAANPLDGYDRVTLIQRGVVSWTLTDQITRDLIEDLDEETQTWLADQVLRLAKPSLFRTPAQAEEARKNG